MSNSNTLYNKGIEVLSRVTRTSSHNPVQHYVNTVTLIFLTDRGKRQHIHQDYIEKHKTKGFNLRIRMAG